MINCPSCQGTGIAAEIVEVPLFPALSGHTQPEVLYKSPCVVCGGRGKLGIDRQHELQVMKAKLGED